MSPILFPILEPDEGESESRVMSCFSARLDDPLGRDAVFHLVHADVINATLIGQFFTYEPRDVVIPGDFSGFYNVCVNATVLGNNVFGGYRSIKINVEAESPFDRVLRPRFVVNIEEDDTGKYLGCLA